MAVTGRITVNETNIYEVDQDPSVAIDVNAPLGSLAFSKDADPSVLWQKANVGINDWVIIKTKTPIILSFFTNTTDYISTTNTTYTKKARFVFPGSIDFGKPIKIKAIVGWSGSISDSVWLKINNDSVMFGNNPIVEKSFSGFQQLPQPVIDLGTLSFIPTNQSIFSVQMKVTAGMTIKLYGLIIEN